MQVFSKDEHFIFVGINFVMLILALSQERENILQRQAEGIAAAKERGVVFGRRPVEIPDDFDDIYRCWRNGEMTSKQTAKLCGFSVKTLYNLTGEWRRQDII